MTVTTRDRAPLRLLPAPSPDPPYDDERTSDRPSVDGSLALAFPTTRPEIPLRLAPPAVARGEVRQFELPDPRQWCRQLIQAVVESLLGDRPVGQLARFATLDVLEAIERAAHQLRPRTRDPRAPRPRLRSVHLSEPQDGVAEACAVVSLGVRSRALALRLEALDGRWQCTAFEVG